MAPIAPAARRSPRRERRASIRTLSLPAAASVGIHGIVLAGLVVALATDPGRRPPGRAVVALEEPVLLEEPPPPPVTPPPEPEATPPGGEDLEDLSFLDAEDPRIAGEEAAPAAPAPAPVEGRSFLGAGLRGFRGGRRPGRREAPPTAGDAAPGSGAGDGQASAPAGPAVRARPIEDACDRPDYPGRERRRGVEGAVELLVAVAASGDVEGVEVAVSSGSEALDRAAAEAVRTWRFSPAMRDGVPVADSVRLRVRFTLVDGPPDSPDG